MGQKVNPLAVRIQAKTKHFDNLWYTDKFFSQLVALDFAMASYINRFLTLTKLPAARFAVSYFPKTTKLYSFFCYPRQTREMKAKLFGISSALGDFKGKKKQLTSFLVQGKKNKISPGLASSSLFPHLFPGIQEKNLHDYEIDSRWYSSMKSTPSHFQLSSKAFQKDLGINPSDLEKINFKNLFFSTSNLLHQRKPAQIFQNFLIFSKMKENPYSWFAQNFQLSSSLSWLDCIPDDKYSKVLEHSLSTFTKSSISLVFLESQADWQDAGYFADELVFFLERRLSFRQIRNRITRQIAENPWIQGVRITCSGRVGGKSKKAQRAKIESFKYGQTSLHIFSSHIDFAARTASTSLGSLGVKVWICYKKF